MEVMDILYLQCNKFQMFYLIYHFASAASLVVELLWGNGMSVFSQPIVRKVFIAFIVAYVGESCGLLMDEFLRLLKYQSDQQAIIYILVFVVFWQFVFFYFQDHLIYKHISTVNITSHNQSQILKKTLFFEGLLQDAQNNYDDAYIKGVIATHLNLPCCNPALNGPTVCFCRQKIVFDAKKRKDATIVMFSSNRSIFSKFLIKSWLETYLTVNPLDHQIRILYAEYLFYKLRRTNLALEQVHFVRRRPLNLQDNFRSFRLILIMREFNETHNQASYQGKLNFENLNDIEEDMQNIKESILLMHETNLKFWKHLKSNQVSLDIIIKTYSKVTNKIKETTKSFQKLFSHLKMKKKWWFYYAWFQAYILNKKLKNLVVESFQGFSVTEKYLFAEDQVTALNQEDVYSQISDDEEQKVESKNLVFDRLAGVIHIADDQNGKILRFNKNFTSIFGVSDGEAININELMPNIYARNHQKYLKQFHQNGRSKALYKGRKIYCLHRYGHIFAAKKYLKLHISPFGQIEYVGMIRPIVQGNQDNHDYILVNDDWEIDSMSRAIIQALNFDFPNLVMKRSNLTLCLLVMCPKLIQMSKLNKFLRDEDLNYLGIKKGEIDTDNVSRIDSPSKVSRTGTMAGTSKKKKFLGPNPKVLLTGTIDDNVMSQLNQVAQQTKPVGNQKQLFLNEPKKRSLLALELDQQASAFDLSKNLSMVIGNEVGDSKEFQKSSQQISQLLEHIQEDENAPVESMQKQVQRPKYFVDKMEGQIMQLSLRIPRDMYELCQEYHQEKQSIKFSKLRSNDRSQEGKSPEKKEEKRYLFLEFNKTQNSLFFSKDRLSSALKIQKEHDESGILDLIKRLYGKYSKRSRSLNKILNVEASIKFQRVGNIEQLGILKINRLHIVDVRTHLENKSTMFLRGETLNLNNCQVVTQKEYNQRDGGYILSNRSGFESDLGDTQHKKFITETQLRDDFNMRLNNRTFNLHPSENIFVKDTNNKSTKSLLRIYYMTWFIRIFFFLIMAFNLLSYFLGPYLNYEQFLYAGERALDLTTLNTRIMETYNQLLDLDLSQMPKYDRYFPNDIQSQTIIKFANTSDYLRSLLQKNSFVETFADAHLFFIEGSGTDPLDLFTQYVLQSNFIASNFTMDSFDMVLKFYRSNLIGKIQPMIANSLVQLLQKVEDSLTSMNNITILFIVFESILSIMGGIAMVPLQNWVCDSFKSITTSFSEIKYQTVKKVYNRMLNLQETFKYILARDHQVSVKLIALNTDEEQDLYFNKVYDSEDDDSKINTLKRKRYEPTGTYHSKLKLKLISVYLIATFLTTILSLILNILVLQKSDQISLQMSLLRTVGVLPNAWVVTVAKERFLNVGINTTLYDNFLLSFVQRIKEQNYTSILTSDPYISSIYYENLCSHLSVEEVSKCESNQNQVLVHGINNYYNQLSTMVKDLISDGEFFGQIPLWKILQEDKGNYYVQKVSALIYQRWLQELRDYINTSQLFYVAYMVSTIMFVMFVYIFVSEGIYIKVLQSNFELHKMLYKRYMPDEVMNQEKKVRVQIVKAGLLQK